MASSRELNLRLEATGQVDCSTLLPLEVSKLPRGLHPRCIAFHPERPLMAVGVQASVGGYDLLSGCRLGRVDVRTPPVHMCFSPDGSLLVVATQEWHIIGVNTGTWRSRVLAPYRAPKNSPLEGVLIAMTSGTKPIVFFTRTGKLNVRMALTSGLLAKADASGKGKDKLKWGLKLKLDIKKPIIAMAAHPSDNQLLLLLEDGSLKGYVMTSTGLSSAYPAAYMVPLDSLGGRPPPSSTLIQAVPHPFLPEACLLLYGSQTGGLAILEVVGKTEPVLLQQGRTPDGAPVIGMGLHKDSRTVMAFVATASGGVRAVGWQLFANPRAGTGAGPSVLGVPISIQLGSLEPINPAISMSSTTTSSKQQQQKQQDAAAAGGQKAAAADAAAKASATPAGSSSSISWQGLWGSSTAPGASFGTNYLLGKLLAPVASHVALHPTLGAVAIQRAPPLALLQAPNIMQQPIGGISPEEAAITRRTASIVLLRVMSDVHPLSFWPGGVAVPMHTGIDFWQTNSGLSPLQFPCHLHYLNQSSICKYSIANKQSGALLSLTPDDPKGTGKGYKPPAPVYNERFMVHSTKQNAWLVFFERSTAAAITAPGAAAVAAGPTGGSSAAAAGPTGGTGTADVPAVAAAPGGMQLPPGVIAAAAAAMAAAAERASGGGAGAGGVVGSPTAAGPTGGPAAAGPTGGGAAAAGAEGVAAAAPVVVRVVPPTTVWEFTLIRGGQNERVTWFLAGKYGVFLGPDDSLFAILGHKSSSVSVYHTATFKGKGPAAYTIQLARPASLGPGLFPGPPAPGVPKEGAEAAAAAAKKAAEDAAAKAKAAEQAGGDGTVDGGEEEKETDVLTEGAAEGVVKTADGRVPRWAREDDSDDEDEEGKDSFIPVLGIGPAFQGGSGGHQQQQHGGLAAVAAAFAGSGGGGRGEVEEVVGQQTSHSGGGVLMWHAAGGKLVMAGLPEPGVTYAAGDDSDDPDAEEEDTEVAKAPHKGQVVGEHSLQLQPDERLLSVSWQNLGPNTPLEPQQVAGALLTTQRLLLVTGDLQVLASVDSKGDSVGVPHPITSFVWAGPALLYMTAAGQVMQLTWTGETQQIASIASHPPAMLLGALVDSVLLLRYDPATGQAEVTSRPLGMLQPLVLGWCSLAAAGLLPKGLLRSRAALQNVLQAFDATHISSGLLWSLIGAWCWDIAAALGQHGVNVDPSVALAANAAAGHWQPVVVALMAEHERSVDFPKPAAEGTALHHKLLAAAAGAICHGQFTAAHACLRAAGEWETALALAMCQADFNTLREMSLGGLQARSEVEAQEVSGLARAMLAAHEQVGRMYSTVTASAGLGTGDWRVRCLMGDNSYYNDAQNWSFGSAGVLPGMETSGFNAPAKFIQAGDVGPIPRCDTSTLGSYLGLSDIADTSSGGAPPGTSSTPKGPMEINLDALMLSSMASGPSITASTPVRRSGSATSVQSSDTDVTLTPGGGAAAGGAASRDPFFDLGGFSDDEDEGQGGGGFANKFKIVIKSKEETGSSSSGSGGVTDLKQAAAKLKLGPLSGPGGLGSRRKKSDSNAGAASQKEDTTALDLGAALGLPGTSSSPSPGRSLPSLPPKGPPAPQLGGPPMKPRAASSASQQTPLFSDEDFFAALAPVIPNKAKQMGAQRSAPPPPRPPQPTTTTTTTSTTTTSSSGSSMKAPDVTKAPPAHRSSDGGLGTLAPPPPLPPPSAAGATSAALLPPPAPVSSLPLPGPPVGRSSSGSGMLGTLAPPPATGAAAAAPVAPAARMGMAPPAPVAAAAAAPVAASLAGKNPTEMYLMGVGSMETANWDAAADAFAATLTALASEPPGPSTTLRQQFAAQYLAAVLLLKVAVAGSGSREATLYRYVAALKLDDRHSLALVKESIVRNKLLGNFRYCGDQLTVLVTRSLGKAPMQVMAQLQEDIDECDRQGGRNASVPGDEGLEDFGGLVSSAQSRQEVEDIIRPLLAAAK